MKAKLQVVASKDREYQPQGKPIEFTRQLACIDAEGTLGQMVKVSMDRSKEWKTGDQFEYEIERISQWKDGTVVLDGQISNPKKV